MVINSTNINKTNNYQSSYLNSVNTKKTTTYDVGNPGPGLEKAQKNGRVKPINGPPPLLITGSPMAIHINKQTIKNLHRFVSTQKDPILSQK